MFRSKINYLGLICGLFCLSTAALAVPPICKSVNFRKKDKLMELNISNKFSQPAIFFIKNTSRQIVWINHPQGQNPHASAGWASSIQPNHWSALLLSRRNFMLDCSTLNNNQVNILDCRRVIRVCTPNMQIPAGNSGGFWVVEDRPWNEFIKAVNARFKK